MQAIVIQPDPKLPLQVCLTMSIFSLPPESIVLVLPLALLSLLAHVELSPTTNINHKLFF